MNIGDAAVVLRPRKLAETFDLALRWCVSTGGWLYIKLSAIVLLPSVLACYALQRFAEWEWPLVWLIALAFTSIGQGVFTVAASRLMFERDVTVGSVLRGFFGKFITYLAALIVTRLYLGVAGLIVIAVPWVWAQVAFIHESVMLEGHPAVPALKRSGAFVSRQYGAVIGMLIGQGLAVSVFVAGMDQVGFVLFDFLLQIGRPFGELFEDGGSLMALLGFHLAIPYIATVRFLHYIDARTRRDGWDIQLAFLGLIVADERAREEAA